MTELKKASFFLAINPPTKTHQQKAVRVVKGKPVFYEPAELAAVRRKLTGHLISYSPDEPFMGPIRLTLTWCFARDDGKKQVNYKTTRPDCDNMTKMFMDCMTQVGFWKDDSLVASLIVEKFWTEIPGIWVKVEELENL